MFNFHFIIIFFDIIIIITICVLFIITIVYVLFFYYYLLLLFFFFLIIIIITPPLSLLFSSPRASGHLSTQIHSEIERLYCWHCITPTRILYDIFADLSTTYCSKTTPQSISKKSSTEDYEKAVALFPGEDKSKGNSVCFCNLRL